MKGEHVIKDLIKRYPALASCEDGIKKACEMIIECYRSGGKLLICGNGGSASDALHIVGELMKGFMKKRSVSEQFRSSLIEKYHDEGIFIADNLQGALPAIALVESSALMTAYINDVSDVMVFAQQVYGLGKSGDVLLGISTSGNSKNILYAVKVAKTMGLKTIGLTGRDGGKMKDFCDVSIVVPGADTPQIQEYHLPVYHAICMVVEEEFFDI